LDLPVRWQQTTHAMTRAAHAVAMDARKKLQEIAAKDLGGKPEDYDIAGERVFRKGGGRRVCHWHAPLSVRSSSGRVRRPRIAQGYKQIQQWCQPPLCQVKDCLAVARDNYAHDGNTFSFVASFAEVEVDVETGQYHILDFLAYADVGTVLHPKALGGRF